MITVRDAVEEDIDFVVEGIRETHIIEKWPEDNLVPNQEKQDAVKAIKNKQIVVAESSGKNIGFLWFDPNFRAMHLDRGNYLWIHLIFIDKNWRNKGLGKTLISNIEEIAKNLGRDELMFDVFEVNKTSMNFFKKQGAQEVYTIYSKKL